MDCSIPFCHQGCPLGNLIPDWNDLVYKNRWREAIDRLHATNNFPEWTGRLCPAPCEASCVLGINDDAVTIKSIEQSIVDRAFDEGWIIAEPPASRTGKQRRCRRLGACRTGGGATAESRGARRDGVRARRPDRRPAPVRDSRIQDGEAVPEPPARPARSRGHRRSGRASMSAWICRTDELLTSFDAVLLTGGAGWARDLTVPGRELEGIHFAMEFLTQQNRRCEGDTIAPDTLITAEGKHVVIIGGGDTGADCYGTVTRQGAKSRPSARAAAATARRARAQQSVARVAEHLPRVARARGGWRARVLGVHRAVHGRCGRTGSTAARGQGGARAGGRADGVQAHCRQRLRHGCRSGARRDGLRGPRTCRPARPISAFGSPSAGTCGRTSAG